MAHQIAANPVRAAWLLKTAVTGGERKTFSYMIHWAFNDAAIVLRPSSVHNENQSGASVIPAGDTNFAAMRLVGDGEEWAITAAAL